MIGITWPVPEGLDDGELERRLFTQPTFDEKPNQPLPDWSYVHNELKRRSGRRRCGKNTGPSTPTAMAQPVLRSLSGLAAALHLGDQRQTHRPAEKLFVDFAGDTVPVLDAAAGMERRAHIFVARAGALVTPMRRPAGRKDWPTGSARTSTR